MWQPPICHFKNFLRQELLVAGVVKGVQGFREYLQPGGRATPFCLKSSNVLRRHHLSAALRSAIPSTSALFSVCAFLLKALQAVATSNAVYVWEVGDSCSMQAASARSNFFAVFHSE